MSNNIYNSIFLKCNIMNPNNCRGEEEEKKSVTQYKADVRTWLTSLGYRVWGVMGAQWNSFAGCPVPKRTFKLPNSIYYIA